MGFEQRPKVPFSKEPLKKKKKKRESYVEGRGALKEFALQSYRTCFAGRKKKSIFYVLFCFVLENLERNEVIVWGKKEKA